MLKAPIGNFQAFANLVLKLLKNPSLYDKISKKAVAGSLNWSWEKRAKKVFNQIQVMF
ncbi:MAG: hypothetical protein ACD_63C00200G0001 [uncultured bacterium]|nr:MAG: hypothetical protein ACD_63C00200G0001 [uncultured bacterium]